MSAGWSHALLRWDLATGKALHDPGGYSGFFHLARSPDGKLLVAADDTGLVELLNGTTGQRVRVLQEAGKPFAMRVAFSADGACVATGHWDNQIRLWKPDSGRLIREIELGKPPKEPGTRFTALEFSPDGGSLAAAAPEMGVKVADVGTGKVVWVDPTDEDKVVFLPRGRSLLSSARSGKLNLRDAATGKVRSSPPSGHENVSDITVSQEGTQLATGHPGGFICLSDPTTGTVRKQWQAHEPKQDTSGVSFGPGGIWLASAGDRTVKVWDAATGALLRKFEGHASRVWSVQFAPDGRTILSSSEDLTGYVWDIRPKLGAADARTAEQLWVDLAGEPRSRVPGGVAGRGRSKGGRGIRQESAGIHEARSGAV